MTVLALGGCILAGCSSTDETSSTEKDTETTVQTEESASEATEPTEETEIPDLEHHVEVLDGSVIALTDDYGEYTTIIPRVIVDGEDAYTVNQTLSDFVENEHPMIQGEYGVSGETTDYVWGVRGDIVSIVIIVDEIGTDGNRYYVFNYNTDTLQPAGNDEVIASFGMTTDEFYGKVADAYRAWWDSEVWLQSDMSLLDLSIEAISPENVTPFVLPDGGIGAAGLTYTPSQFYDAVKCFDLDTLSITYFTE